MSELKNIKTNFPLGSSDAELEEMAYRREPKWWHSGLDSFDAPQIECMSHEEVEDCGIDKWLGPFESFEEARVALLRVATEHVIEANGLVERVKAMRGKGRKR